MIFTRQLKEFGVNTVSPVFIVSEKHIFSIYRSKSNFQEFVKSVDVFATKNQDKIKKYLNKMDELNNECLSLMKRIPKLETTDEDALKLLKQLESFIPEFWKYYIFTALYANFCKEHGDKSMQERLVGFREKTLLFDLEPILEEFLVKVRKELKDKKVLFNTLSELIDYFEKNKELAKGKIRFEKYVLYSDDEITRKTLVKKEAEEFIEKYSDDSVDDEEEIKGEPAYPGHVVGRARVVEKVQDLKKAKKGEVLITHMTTVQMEPYLKGFKAFVTDEGGILCHAAIFSRERKIPCILGTGNATKLFKNGDYVEVDADNGIVRKLK